MTRTTPLLVALLLSSAACRASSADDARRLPERWSPDAVAAVNGVAITEADLAQYNAGRGHRGEGARAPIDELIAQELAAQRAVELGLDDDKAFRDELARRTAELEAFRRNRLATAFNRHLAQQVVVTGDEARAYFDRNADRIRTELHVWQIMVRDPADAEQVESQLAAGTPFEKVAAERAGHPAVGKKQAAWDLGWLRWNQVPEAWLPVVEGLAPGAVSRAIPGPGKRFWFIKLIERRAVPDLDFEQVRPLLVEQLTAGKVKEVREQAERDLLGRARIVREAASAPTRLAGP